MQIIVYSKNGCPGCDQVKRLLDAKKLDFVERNIDSEPQWVDVLRKLDLRQMPQVYIQNQRVGGFAGLKAALEQLGI